MRKTVLIITLLAAASQADLYLEGNFQVTDPKNELQDALNRSVFGGNVGGGWVFNPIPVALGLDIGLISLGKQSSDHDWPTKLNRIKQTTKSKALLAHLVLRTQLPEGPVRPYADALFGFKSFKTNTQITNNSNDTLSSTENLSDYAISYGLRGGLGIFPQKESPFGITLGVQYLWGGEADFYDAINPPNADYSLPIQRSRTDMLTYSIGICLNMK